MNYPTVILSPDNRGDSGTCVMLHSANHLYIQSFDAYGFQRELILKQSQLKDFELHVYQHPGRRELRYCNKLQGGKLFDALVKRAKSNPDLLFNASGNQPKNTGFVRFQEACFRGNSPTLLLEMI